MISQREIHLPILIRASTVLVAFASSEASAQSIRVLNPDPLWPLVSVAKGVSRNGVTVVGYSMSQAGVTAATVWVGTRDGQRPFGVSAGSETVGISDDGDVVAGWQSSSAFRWTPTAGVLYLAPLPGGSWTSARGISGDGSTIIGEGSTNSGPFTPTYSRAFRWNADGSVQQLGALQPTANSVANAANFIGSVIVGESGGQAFRWTIDGGMAGLGVLAGASSSRALSVNRDGSVVVGGSGGTAFRWTSARGMEALETLGAGDHVAYAVANDGALVVGSRSFYTAMCWDASGRAALLADYLVGRGVELSGWTSLFNAYGISGDGRFIVGWGSYQGQNRAFVADVGVDADGDGVTDTLDNCPGVANPKQDDCNGDGVGDACEIADGAADFNGNHIPDSCECPADLFADGQVNGADLGVVLSQWGQAPATSVSDLNRDGSVDGADLGYLLASWGACTN